MADFMLRHKGKCKGAITANLGNLFEIVSPGISITSAGIKIGTAEVRAKRGPSLLALSCQKCGEDFSETSELPIECQCFVCRSYHSASNMYVSQNIPPICDSCLKVLTGKAEPTNDKIRTVTSFILLPNEGLKFVSLTEVIKTIHL